jgi:hypothetical protein
MRINLRQTTSMKRHLVYTTDDLPARPFDPIQYFASTLHQNCYLTARVEKVGLAEADQHGRHRRRLITAAKAWLFLASQLRRVERVAEAQGRPSRAKRNAKEVR